MKIKPALTYRTLARANPVLPPRRREETAMRWAQQLNRICQTLPVEMPTDGEWRKWAATLLLTETSAMPVPPVEVDGELDGSMRSHAADQGGIAGSIYHTLARLTVRDLAPPTDLQWGCWTTLYPASASLAYRNSSTAAVAEWEIVHSDDAILAAFASAGWPVGAYDRVVEVVDERPEELRHIWACHQEDHVNAIDDCHPLDVFTTGPDELRCERWELVDYFSCAVGRLADGTEVRRELDETSDKRVRLSAV